MAKARCPRCGGLFGPPPTILFHHLRDDEHEYIEWYEANPILPTGFCEDVVVCWEWKKAQQEEERDDVSAKVR